MLKLRVVTDEGKRIRLIIPDGPFVVKFLLKKALENQEVHFDRKKFSTFMKVYRQVKRMHPRLVLVDVKSHDGTSLFIKL